MRALHVFESIEEDILKVKYDKDYFSINYFINNEDVGEIIVKIHIGSNDYFYIQGLYVEKEYRQRGIATKLMNKLIAILPECSKTYNIHEVICIAEPYQENITERKLVQFYKSFGFKNVPRMKTNYLVLHIKNNDVTFN